MPERFKCQILSFVRIEWPELFSGNLRLRDWTTKPEMHPVSFLLEEEGVLTTVKGFYEQAGFEPMDNLVTLVGDPQNPEQSDETGFMLFVSEKGKRGRNSFEKGPLYFGEKTW